MLQEAMLQEAMQEANASSEGVQPRKPFHYFHYTILYFTLLIVGPLEGPVPFLV